MEKKNGNLDMNNVLLNMNMNSINMTVLKKNIEEIYTSLYFLSPKKMKIEINIFVYLVFSVLS